MQYELQIFHYEPDFQFRTMDINGENWFVLADACRALDIKNPSDAARRLDDDEKGIAPADTLRGTQSMLIVNESGLFSLILRSDKPQAKKFKKWVTSEVLPSIRRTGSYIPGGVPAFIHRFNQNWGRTDVGYFSVLSELAIRIWGRFEQIGYRMKESTAAGVELRPDISVGIRFAEWLRKNHPTTAAKHKEYLHWTAAGEFPARQYENSVWPLFVEFRRYRLVSGSGSAIFQDPRSESLSISASAATGTAQKSLMMRGVARAKAAREGLAI